MKNIVKLTTVAAGVALLAGCASNMPVGVVYNGASLPVNATTNAQTTKVGQACTSSLFSLFAWGDGTIATAKANGGITNVSSIDYKVKNVLGIYGTYCTVVTGS